MYPAKKAELTAPLTELSHPNSVPMGSMVTLIAARSMLQMNATSVESPTSAIASGQSAGSSLGAVGCCGRRSSACCSCACCGGASGAATSCAVRLLLAPASGAGCCCCCCCCGKGRRGSTRSGRAAWATVSGPKTPVRRMCAAACAGRRAGQGSYGGVRGTSPGGWGGWGRARAGGGLVAGPLDSRA